MTRHDDCGHDGAQHGHDDDGGLGGAPAEGPDAFAVQAREVLLRSVDRAPAERRADRLAGAAAGLLGVDAGGVSVLLAPQMSVPVGVSDAGAEMAERVQFSVGEGPCWAAYQTGIAMLVDDLAGASGEGGALPTAQTGGSTAPPSPGRGGERSAVHRQWPAYTAAMLQSTPFRGVVSLPLRVRLGVPVVLNLYSRARLSGRATDAGALTLLARGVGDVLSGTGGSGAPGREWLDSSSTRRRSQVWVAEELLVRAHPGMDVDGALNAMRTYCAVHGGTVDEVAEAVVGGRLTPAAVLGQ
ncbi:hypothetical protein [Quadrisphaera sp. KR29]|uniref:hypothetical protein n=1 Tax=Quadrisphaera sp. KR29 TaxID=3461391 RepID=UPI0040442F5F